MANITGSISSRGSKGHHTFNLSLTETENSYNVTNNTSPVAYTFSLTDDNNWYWSSWGTAISYTITIGDETITGYIPHHTTATQTVASGTVTIRHADDGTKSINYSFSISDSSGQSYTCGSASASGTLTLQTIPRASTLTLSTTSVNTLGSVVMTINSASDSFTHNITTVYNNTTRTLASNQSTSSKTKAITFNLGTSTTTDAFYLIRQDLKSTNTSSTTLTITLTTKSGSTVIGTKTYSLTISVPLAAVASISPNTVSCDSTITVTLENYDAVASTATLERLYGTTVVYSATSTTSNLANTTFEEYITTSTKGTATVRVTTKVGTKNLGSQSSNYTDTIPTGTYKPSISLTTNPSKTGTAYGSIAFLAGYNGASMKFTEGKTGHSNIVTRTVTIDKNTSVSYTTSGSVHTVTTGTLPSNTADYTAKVTFTVKDGRGVEASATASITVAGYSLPTFTSATAIRATSSGTVDGEGTYANLSATARAHSTAGSITSVVLYFDKGTSTPISGTTTSASGVSRTTSIDHYVNGTALVITQEYTFTAVATDALGFTTTIYFYLAKASVTLSLHKNVGIGLGTTAVAGEINSSLSMKMTEKSRGYYLKDSTGFNYPVAYDNQSNLWIGSTQTAAQHHRGGTYISSGYNGTAGNATIHISVPNAANTSASNYDVYHTGYKPTKSDVGLGNVDNTADANKSVASATSATNATNATNVYTTDTNPTSATWYRVAFHNNGSGTNVGIRGQDGLLYYTLQGTASALGESLLRLGNNTASGTAGNKRGRVRLYAQNAYYVDLLASNTPSASRTQYLPDQNGTLVVNAVTNATGVVTKSSGGATLSSSQINIFGKVAQLNIVITGPSGSQSDGTILFVGTITNTAYRPKAPARGVDCYGTSSLIGFITTAGAVTIRAMDAGTYNTTLEMVFTYIIP